MNKEDLAKRQLFDFDDVQIFKVYDPYRNNNILKESNRSEKIYPDFNSKTFYQQKKKANIQNQGNKDNNLRSLKRLLRRLESIPSPDKKHRLRVDEASKTLGMISSTEPVFRQRKKSIFVKTYTDEKSEPASDEKLQIRASRPVSQHSCKTAKQKNKNTIEEARIRNLIKQKIAQKNRVRVDSTNQKVINYLESNARSSLFVKKLQQSSLRPNSRKLINLLS